MFSVNQANSQIDTAWTRKYNGPGSSNDEARRIIPDNNGNIYVAGTIVGDANDISLFKYNSHGDTIWQRTFSGAQTGADEYFLSMVISDSGYVYIACCSFYIPATYTALSVLKYSSAGSLLWVKSFNGVKGESNGKPTKRLAVDGFGNIYFTGTKNYNYYTVKLNPSGDTLWTRSYGNPGYTYDDPSALAIDNTNNVFVTGKVYINGSYDYCTLKYSTAGQLIWARLYDGPAHNTDYAYAIITDISGNCYVTGSIFIGGASNTDFCTIKYSPVGDTVWTKKYDGSVSLSDEAFILLSDDAGNIYSGGNSYEGAPSIGGTGTDFCVVKYSAAGAQLKVFLYNGSGNDEDYLNDFIVDADNDVFMAGESFIDNTVYRDFCVTKFSNAGSNLWSWHFGGNNADKAYAVCVNDSSELFAVGMVNYDLFTVKFRDISAFVENSDSGIQYNSVSVFPNPATDKIRIDFFSNTKGNINISVFNTKGKSVLHKDQSLENVGINSFIINVDDFSSGLYYFTIYMDNEIIYGKFIVID
jgi:hypothetical protein